jgi:hypothetical protein
MLIFLKLSHKYLFPSKPKSDSGDILYNKRSSLSKKWKVGIIVIAVVVVVILIAIPLGSYIYSNYYTRSTSTYTITHTYTVKSLKPLINLASSNYIFSLSPGNYWDEYFTVPNYATNTYINGSYISNNNVEVLILTPVEYGAFTQNPSNVINSGDYVWYSGSNEGETIDISLVPGQTYYLVFYNPNTGFLGIGASSDTVTIEAPINVWGYVLSYVTSTTTITQVS